MKKKLFLALGSLLVLASCKVSITNEVSHTSNSNNISSSEVTNTSSSEDTSKENSSNTTTSDNNTSSSNATSSNNTSLSSSQNTSSEDKNTSSSQDTSSAVNPSVDESITSYGTYGEAIYAEWNDSNVDKAKVYYKLTSETNYQQIDKELVRTKSTGVARMDILGLKKGVYDVKIVTSSNQELLMHDINVTNYDRSGYAHFKASQAVGGYNNDGTPKTGATIVYVNDENKNTVSATINKKTYVGLTNILKAAPSTPLIVRILGRVNAATWKPISYGSSAITPDKVVGSNGKALPNKNLTEDDIISGGYNQLDTSKYTKLNGLSNRIKYDSSKKEFDSYYNMLDVSGAKNVTLEGVGDDAMFFQFGITWKSCSYVEVRNITFDDYTEDACAFEGTKSDDSATLSGFSTGHNWIHNNTFNEGKNYWDVCNEQDKHEGDGATDLKLNAYTTISYNHYYKNHKTGLVGGSDTQHTAAITFHHNFYDQCSSRLPLGRRANMHMYNNYYYKSSNYSMSLRGNAYALVENCYFEGGKTPMEVKSGAAIKAYNNTYSGVSSSIKDVASRTTTVSNSNEYGTDFDTNSSIFYYDATNKVSNVSYLASGEQVKEDAKNYAGPAHNNPTSKTAVDPTPTPDPVDPTPTEPTGDQVIFNASDLDDGEITSDQTKGMFTIKATSEKPVTVASDSSFSTFDSKYTKVVKFGGSTNKNYRNITFTLTQDAKIKIYAKSANASTSRSLGLYSSNSLVKTFDPIISATELTATLSKGTYYIGSINSGMNVAAIVVTYNA